MSFRLSTSSSLSLFLSLSLLLLLLPCSQAQEVVTKVQRCFSPPPLPNFPPIPQLCADVGFAACSSLAINVTILVDGQVVFQETEPNPLTFTYSYPLGTGCDAVIGLSQSPAPVLTPTYIHAQPLVRILCFNQQISSQTLDYLTLGADCSSLDCYNCTTTPSCGWCSNEPNFANEPSTGDPELYQRLSTNGRCLGRGPNSKPWCDSCTYAYAVGQSVCPVYTGSSAQGGGDDGNAAKESAGGLFNGNKGYQALFAAFIIAMAVMAVVIAYLCYKRSKASSAAGAGAGSAARPGKAGYERQVEMDSTATAPLTDGTESEYLPPSMQKSLINSEEEMAGPVISSHAQPAEL